MSSPVPVFCTVLCSMLGSHLACKKFGGSNPIVAVRPIIARVDELSRLTWVVFKQPMLYSTGKLIGFERMITICPIAYLFKSFIVEIVPWTFRFFRERSVMATEQSCE